MKKVISIIVYVGIIPDNLSYENLAENTAKIFNIKNCLYLFLILY
ncbi:hypothetical protein [Clostridium botulinum]|nr:hypothetical protein [Clostridium botulinum]